MVPLCPARQDFHPEKPCPQVHSTFHFPSTCGGHQSTAERNMSCTWRLPRQGHMLKGPEWEQKDTCRAQPLFCAEKIAIPKVPTRSNPSIPSISPPPPVMAGRKQAEGLSSEKQNGNHMLQTGRPRS
eukprot:EG_transcript_35930